MPSNRRVRYKCPFCDLRFERAPLVTHVEEEHGDELPEDFTAMRYVFNYVNKKPLDYHGRCTECGGPTDWDENKGRYNRQCNKKACHDSFIRKSEENMRKKTGHARVTETEEGQIKMLQRRKISGTYVFKNGKSKEYVGSYELKALEFMDKVMNINPDDLMCPGPVLEYKLDGKRHMYITDFYYIPYDLVIEVKDGGDNPNKRNMPEYRAKQIAKERYIIEKTNFNYLRLTNNDFSQLLSVFMDLKMQLVDETNDRVVHINEVMGMAGYAPVKGLRDSDAYIVLRPSQNNVFATPSIGITDGNLDSIFGIDSDGKLNRLDDGEVKKIKESGLDIFYIVGTTASATRALDEYIGKVIEDGDSGLYRILTGKKLLDSFQLQFNHETVKFPKFDINKVNEVLNSIVSTSDIDAIEESVREVITNG